MQARRTSSYQARQFATGFTAIELMVVVSIVAILAALAAPSFSPLIENWRVRESAEQLQSTLYYARSEAIKRGGQVLIQKIPNNTNGSGTCTAADPVLQRVESSAKVHVNRTSGGATIQLNRWGLVDGTWLGFNLVPLDKTVSHVAARGVCMSSGGRVRIIPQEAIPCTA